MSSVDMVAMREHLAKVFGVKNEDTTLLQFVESIEGQLGGKVQGDVGERLRTIYFKNKPQPSVTDIPALISAAGLTDETDLLLLDNDEIDAKANLNDTQKAALKDRRKLLMTKNGLGHLTPQELAKEQRSTAEKKRIKEQAFETKASLEKFLEEVGEYQTQVRQAVAAENYDRIQNEVRGKVTAMMSQLKRVPLELPKKADIEELLKELREEANVAKGQLTQVESADLVDTWTLVRNELKLLCGVHVSNRGCFSVDHNSLKIIAQTDENLVSVRDVSSTEFSVDWMSSSRTGRVIENIKSAGATMTAGAQAKGAAIVGAGVGAFTAHSEMSAAKDWASEKGQRAASTSFALSRLFLVHKEMATFDVSLGATVHVSDDLKNMLLKLVESMMACSESDEVVKDPVCNTDLREDVEHMLKVFGTHVRTRVKLGGVLIKETKVKVSSAEAGGSTLSALSTQAELAVGGSAGAATVLGGGMAAAEFKGSAHAGSGDHHEERGEAQLAHSRVTIHVIGGAENNKEHPHLWRQSLLSRGSWKPVKTEKFVALWEREFLDLLNLSAVKRKLLATVIEHVWVVDIMGYDDCKTAQELERKAKGLTEKLREEEGKEEAAAKKKAEEEAAATKKAAEEAELQRQQKRPNSDAVLQAAQEGDERKLKGLLEEGYSPESKDADGRTALHWAALCGHTGAVETLLHARCAVDARDDSNCTPLHWAAYNGHVGAVKALLARGADKTLRNNEGKTPLEWARQRGHSAVVEVLQ